MKIGGNLYLNSTTVLFDTVVYEKAHLGIKSCKPIAFIS